MPSRARPLALALALLALTPAAAGAADGRIVFMTSRDGDYEIYSMDGDGSDPRRLTRSKGWDEYPKWSPDGTRIAFTSRRDTSHEVYVMGQDGSGQTRLTFGADQYTINHTPAWAPAGDALAFASNTGGAGDLWRVDADGTDRTGLTSFPAGTGSAFPDYSPDGARIVFSSSLGSAPGTYESDLWTVNADGTGLAALTDTPDRSEHGPAWSPDGARIAFSSLRAGAGEGIETVAPDGSGRTQITNGFRDGGPAWSPDARTLAFHRTDGPGATQQIFTVPVAGGTPEQITRGTGDAHSAFPDWRAGGSGLGPAPRLSRLAATAAAGRVKVSFSLDAGTEVELALHRCKRTRAGGCRTGRRLQVERVVARAGRTRVQLGRGLSAGRYKVIARAGDGSASAVARLR